MKERNIKVRLKNVLLKMEYFLLVLGVTILWSDNLTASSAMRITIDADHCLYLELNTWSLSGCRMTRFGS